MSKKPKRKTYTVKPPTLSANEMKLLVEQEKDKRAKECWEQLKVVLTKFNCDLDASIMVSRFGNKVEINLIALDAK